MVRVLKTIGFDRHYTRAEGPYLFDKHGRALPRSAGGLRRLRARAQPPDRQEGDAPTSSTPIFPNLVQMDVSLLSGLLAERLLAHVPGQERVFFCNSGTEAVEAAIKLSRAPRRDARSWSSATTPSTG